MATEAGPGESLERNLEQLLERERFEPPQEFVENALRRRRPRRGRR